MVSPWWGEETGSEENEGQRKRKGKVSSRGSGWGEGGLDDVAQS